MKKLLLGLGTLSLTALPVLAIVSCGGSTSETKTDLKITSKSVEQKVIDDAITAYKAATADDVKIKALSTVFDGITTDNFKNFSVDAKAGSGSVVGTIVLTANSGFAFGKESTLSSKVKAPVTTDLKITSKSVEQKVIDDAITAYKAAATDDLKVTALSPVFDGITTANLKNFSVDAKAGSGSVAGTIVLTANSGFAFGKESTLSSKVKAPVTTDLKITSKSVEQKVIDDAITAYPLATTDNTKVTVLSTVFDGITAAKLKNFDVKATATSGPTPGTIVLTAKSGYAFGTVSTLSSKVKVPVVVDLNITNKAAVDQAIINKAITDFNAATTDPVKIAALSTVFSGITIANFKNFDVTATSGSTPGKIVLTAKSGFTFGGQQTLTSAITSTVTDLQISTKLAHQDTINEAITAYNAAKNNPAIVTALSPVFEGITEAKLGNLAITTAGSGKVGSITLTAKPGFNFAGQEAISSTIDLPLLLKGANQTVVNQAITDFNRATTDTAKITALSTVFSGITTANFKNFDVKATAGTPGTIVLTAKPGFGFNGQATLSS